MSDKIELKLKFALEYYADWNTYNQQHLTMECARKLRGRAVKTLYELKQWTDSRGLAAPDGGPSATYYDRLRKK